MKERAGRFEARDEHDRFREMVAEHRLNEILSPTALTLAFLALGDEMWKKQGVNDGADR